MPDADYDALRAAFEKHRKDQQLSFDALVRMTGIARSSIIDIAQGRTRGSLESWHRLAHALDVPLADLMRQLCADHGTEGTS
ncbi:transcriptional regulator [Amycolatopsis antarctica]|uniref:Transcriptional regulator n=1 Tax=Amycolatopsis antarctica TaxID=1854586 RepID=A0A263CYJ0_9PSEU|nr:transcriptional regulator [Amycolatopsis antarctica]